MIECFCIGESLPEAYETALCQLEEEGEIIPCPAYGTSQKEVSMTMVVREPLREPAITRLAFLTYESLQQYLMEMLDGILDFEVENGKWKYTYHQRIMKSFDAAIEELRRDPWSRRAVIDVRSEEDIGDEDPACLQNIQYFVRENKLHCKVLFRSNDALEATFMNCFALIKLQERAAALLNLEVGSFTLRANSFHCYAKNFEDLEYHYKRIMDDDEKELTYFYEGDWKEEMESCIPAILKKVEELKERDGIIE